MSSVLIVGTDTGVGKTIVCKLLAAYLRGRGLSVITQKWVQTGCELSDDIALHDNTHSANDLDDLRVPYSLKYPASPHLAAAIEGVKIDVAKIEAAHNELARRFDMVIVEGSGGALVPITESELLADVAVRLDIPVVIVVNNKLGCINHTLLTVEALRSRDLRIIGLIFNRIESEGDEAILLDNIRITGLICGVAVLGELPHMTEPQYPADLFRPIGDAFYRKWSNINE
ncbi:MAG: dethiobiotin synthase [Armatimonadota bacterium]